MRPFFIVSAFLALFPASAALPQGGSPDLNTAPSSVRAIAENFAAGRGADLSRHYAMFVKVIENPGPQKDINARRITSVERSPVDTKYDYLKTHLQTLPRDGGNSRLYEALGGRRNSRDVALFGTPDAGWVAVQGWQDSGQITMSILHLTPGLTQAKMASLNFPLGDKGFSAGEDVSSHVPNDISVAFASDGDLLLSFDTLNRCSGDRRMGVVMRLAASFDRLEWVSPLRVAGGRHFAFSDKSLFAIDGGSCEKDYLYELDLNSGKVKTRQVMPSAQDAGDFTALNGNDLYLVLYNRFIHYKLR
ncbi:hypothetical protein J7443_13995 [Tropicibacter sp. R15_0]|uniref:hypothetical protein n=1 Tax=Tropicibacter sp. R15_0 TaxID=2821101 RepID=UPI001ADCFAFA|nr:hypothetical protein [Tropicibacter sp. R15_0]MBO9466352.1 hypothetical protein [Tropicibacter sp. R15_0]